MSAPLDQILVISASISGTLTVAYSAVPALVLPFAADLVSVDLVVGTAPTGATILANVKQNGTALFSGSGRPTIAISGTAATQVVPAAPVAQSGQNTTYANVITASVPNFVPLAVGAKGDVFTIGIDQIGSGTAGSNATFALTFARR